MNTFMNLVKRSLVEGGIKGEIRAFEGIKALVGASLLPVLNSWTGPWPASSFCSSVRLAEGLT